MARGMQPAAGTVALVQQRGLPSPRRCAAATKRQTHQVGCINSPPRNLPLSTTESDRLRSPALSCTCSGSSSGAATWSSSRSPPANGWSWRDRVDDDDAVPGDRVVVISGYWTGPDMDDGCGHVQAIVQRISASQ